MIIICVPVPKDFSIDVRTAAYCSAEAVRPGVKWGYVSSREAGVGRSTFAYYALKLKKMAKPKLLMKVGKWEKEIWNSLKEIMKTPSSKKLLL